MSTPLVVLAVILAILTFVLIPLMMVKGDRERKQEPQHGKQGQRPHKKKRKR